MMVIDSRARAITFRQIVPRRSDAQDMKDAVEYLAVFATLGSARLLGQQGSNDRSFFIG